MSDVEKTPLDNLSILRNPSINKGTAFTKEERLELGLLGLLPFVESDIDDQIKRRMSNFDDQKDEFAKVTMLKNLKERNEVLYFKMLSTYPEKLLPYVYTPFVGETALKFSSYYTQSRGIFFAYPDREYIDKIVASIPQKEVQAIVITDGSRILGLGDMGAGGMAIPIGKLDLYTVFGGIDPAKVLPITIDVGTNNPDLLKDPFYIGWRHERITGKEYDDFIDRIVNALKKRYPNVLLQWEDFSKEHARVLLDRYYDKILSFNDDIQGTAASALVAITTAMNIIKGDIKQAKIVILGGGSAGTGIADLLLHAMITHGYSAEEAKKRIFIIDREGLLLNTNPKLDAAQKVFAFSPKDVEGFDLDKDGKIGLLDAIIASKANILIGVSSQTGMFDQKVCEAMAKNTPRPVIMPLSNPTSKSEATPKDILNWTKGQALIATGSPFDPVEYQGKTYFISQCNNVYVFPGLGLGLILAKAKKVPVELFVKAVEVVAAHAMKNQDGRLFPKISDLREVSKAVGLEVAKEVVKMGLSLLDKGASLTDRLKEIVWEPVYKKIKKY